MFSLYFALDAAHLVKQVFHTNNRKYQRISNDFTANWND